MQVFSQNLGGNLTITQRNKRTRLRHLTRRARSGHHSNKVCSAGCGCMSGRHKLVLTGCKIKNVSCCMRCTTIWAHLAVLFYHPRTSCQKIQCQHSRAGNKQVQKKQRRSASAG